MPVLAAVATVILFALMHLSRWLREINADLLRVFEPNVFSRRAWFAILGISGFL